MNYEVAVMNYPLFHKGVPTDAAEKILGPPHYHDPGGPWPISVYLHIPFCDSLCDFCVYDRQLTVGKQELVDEFVKALLTEIEVYARAPRFLGQKIGAIFIGGGTPTALSAQQLDDLLKKLGTCFDLQGSEITVECNPLNACEEKLSVLKERGVTRISTGIQSFDNRLRKKFHIAVNAEEAEYWIKTVRKYQFGDISLDLIYGFPGVDSALFLKDLRQAVGLGMGHVSVYKLAVFAYTALYKKLQRTSGARKAFPSEKNLYEMFSEAHRFLLKNGYELQSAQEYGQRGKRAAFWEATYDGFGDNLSMGTSGFGYVNGYCYQNTADVSRYIRLLKEKKLPIGRMSPKITPEQQRERALVMGFRRGFVPREPYEKAFGEPMECRFEKKLIRLEEQGFLEGKEDRYLLTKKGLFYQGNVSADFMISIFRGVSPLKKKMCIGNHEMP